MKLKTLFMIVLTIVFSGITNVIAQTSVHGFGSWGYGKTDGNNYIIGTEEGNASNAQFSLNVSSKLYEELTINTQIYYATKGIYHTVELDYAFGEWAFSDQAKLRFGKVMIPFGIYSEIFDVGTLRPFFVLPRAIYGSPGIVSRSYFGGGITGSYFFENDWGLQYDLYAGELTMQGYKGQQVFPAANEVGAAVIQYDVDLHTREMLGGRLIIHTPLEGFNFGTSAYQGVPEFFINGEKESSDDRYATFLFHAEYLSEAWSIRSEKLILRQLKGDQEPIKLDGVYFEVAYKFTEHWQLAAIYDQQKIELTQPVELEGSAAEHKEIAFGINYWFKPEYVLKVSYHMVDGNFYTTPKDHLEAFLAGGPNSKTNLFLFGTQFSF